MKKKRRYRQAAAFLLTAVLILSTGTGSPVFAEAEETEPVTGQEQVTEPVTEIESPTETETVTGGETTGESELITEPVTETETDAETEPVTESETAGETLEESEPETEPVTETESETQNMPPAQVQSAPPAQNQILEDFAETDEAVQSVQELIDALPTAEELKAMSLEEQQVVYEQVQAAYDAYNALTDEQKEQITGAEVIDDLFDVFNSMAALAVDNVGFTYSINDGETQTTKESTLTINGAWNNQQDCTVTEGNGESISISYGNLTLNGGLITVTGSISTNKTITIESGDITAQTISSTVNDSNTTCAITIKGGTVNTDSITCFATTNNSEAQITISGGIVTTNNLTVSGYRDTSDFPTTLTVNGNAVLFVTNKPTVTVTSTTTLKEPEYTKGVVFEGTSGNVYGSVTLPDGVTIPEGYTLTIPSGATLTVPAGSTLTNEGTINVSGGTFTNNGTIENYGTISGTVGGTTPQTPATVTMNDANGTYGGSVTLTASVTGGSGAVNSGTVTFYRGTADNGTSLGSANVSNGTATLSNVALNSTNWIPSNSPYTITAVYSGGTGLLGGSGQGTLSVSKATPEALPDGPNILKEKTTTSVTLNPVDNDGADIYGTIQYGYKTGDETSVPEDRWQNSNAFTKLSPGTDYNFFTRYAGNDYYNPSNPSYFGYLITTLPSITTTSLTSGYVGVEYKAQLEASVADNKTVTWTLANWASLPDGLTLDAETGVISGVPKVAAASHSFTVQASIDGIDSYEQITNTATLTITIERGTPADPKEGEGYTINYEEETVTAWDGYELSVSENETGSGTLTVTPGTNVYVRLKETETYYASNWVEVTIPARPVAPDLTIDTQAEGVILSENYCYSFNSSTYAGDWQQGSGQLIQVEPGNTIYIYEAAVNSSENPHFKSEIKSITAPARFETPSMPTIDYTNEVLNGTSVGMEYRVGNGSWTPCIDGAMDLEQYFGWNGTDKVDVYFRTAAANSSYASEPTQALTIPARPTLDVEVTDVTAKGFTVTVDGAPTDAALIYRARGTGEYDDYDSGERTSGIFTGLKANALYDVSVECAATSNTFSAEAIGTGTTGVATYTVSIPSQATAGGNPVSISIDSEAPFDLGTDGRVNVKIIDDDKIKDGVLTLTREGAANTVTSALSVGGSLFTDLSQNVATFTEDSKDPVSLSFAAPTEKDIPAGTYKGTVNFEISYTQ